MRAETERRPRLWRLKLFLCGASSRLPDEHVEATPPTWGQQPGGGGPGPGLGVPEDLPKDDDFESADRHATNPAQPTTANTLGPESPQRARTPLNAQLYTAFGAAFSHSGSLHDRCTRRSTELLAPLAEDEVTLSDLDGDKRVLADPDALRDLFRARGSLPQPTTPSGCMAAPAGVHAGPVLACCGSPFHVLATVAGHEQDGKDRGMPSACRGSLPATPALVACLPPTRSDQLLAGTSSSGSGALLHPLDGAPAIHRHMSDGVAALPHSGAPASPRSCSAHLNQRTLGHQQAGAAKLLPLEHDFVTMIRRQASRRASSNGDCQRLVPGCSECGETVSGPLSALLAGGPPATMYATAHMVIQPRNPCSSTPACGAAQSTASGGAIAGGCSCCSPASGAIATSALLVGTPVEGLVALPRSMARCSSSPTIMPAHMPAAAAMAAGHRHADTPPARCARDHAMQPVSALLLCARSGFAPATGAVAVAVSAAGGRGPASAATAQSVSCSGFSCGLASSPSLQQPTRRATATGLMAPRTTGHAGLREHYLSSNSDLSLHEPPTLGLALSARGRDLSLDSLLDLDETMMSPSPSSHRTGTLMSDLGCGSALADGTAERPPCHGGDGGQEAQGALLRAAQQSKPAPGPTPAPGYALLPALAPVQAAAASPLVGRAGSPRPGVPTWPASDAIPSPAHLPPGHIASLGCPYVQGASPPPLPQQHPQQPGLPPVIAGSAAAAPLMARHAHSGRYGGPVPVHLPHSAMLESGSVCAPSAACSRAASPGLHSPSTCTSRCPGSSTLLPGVCSPNHALSRPQSLVSACVPATVSGLPPAPSTLASIGSGGRRDSSTGLSSGLLTTGNGAGAGPSPFSTTGLCSGNMFMKAPETADCAAQQPNAVAVAARPLTAAAMSPVRPAPAPSVARPLLLRAASSSNSAAATPTLGPASDAPRARRSSLASLDVHQPNKQQPQQPPCTGRTGNGLIGPMRRSGSLYQEAVSAALIFESCYALSSPTQMESDPDGAAVSFCITTPPAGALAYPAAAAAACTDHAARSKVPSMTSIGPLDRSSVLGSGPLCRIRLEDGLLAEPLALLIGLSDLRYMTSGAYAAVYRGQWDGAPVAVKFLASTSLELETPAMREALLGPELDHPNIVTTLTTRVARFDTSALMRLAAAMPAAPAGGGAAAAAPAARLGGGAPAPASGRQALGTPTAGRETASCSQVETHAIAPGGYMASISYQEGMLVCPSGANSPPPTPLASRSAVVSGTFSNRALPPAAAGSSSSGLLQSLRSVLSTLGVLGPTGQPTADVHYVTAVVMEFADAGNLDKLSLQKGVTSSLSCTAAAELLLQVASGMEHLHAQGLMHGDLKPANVLLFHPLPPPPPLANASSSTLPALAAGGTHAPAAQAAADGGERGVVCKLADFGLTFLLRGRSADGRGGAAAGAPANCGTVAYSAPERFQEQGEPASDVWSFAVCMWQLVAGKRPFQDLQIARIMFGLLYKDLKPEWPAGRCTALEPLYRRCTAYDPALRPTFAEVVTELQGVLAMGPGACRCCRPCRCDAAYGSPEPSSAAL